MGRNSSVVIERCYLALALITLDEWGAKRRKRGQGFKDYYRQTGPPSGSINKPKVSKALIGLLKLNRVSFHLSSHNRT